MKEFMRKIDYCIEEFPYLENDNLEKELENLKKLFNCFVEYVDKKWSNLVVLR